MKDKSYEQIRALFKSSNSRPSERLPGLDCDGLETEVWLHISTDGKWVRAESDGGNFHFKIKHLRKHLEKLEKAYKEQVVTAVKAGQEYADSIDKVQPPGSHELSQ